MKYQSIQNIQEVLKVQTKLKRETRENQTSYFMLLVLTKDRNIIQKRIV